MNHPLDADPNRLSGEQLAKVVQSDQNINSRPEIWDAYGIMFFEYRENLKTTKSEYYCNFQNNANIQKTIIWMLYWGSDIRNNIKKKNKVSSLKAYITYHYQKEEITLSAQQKEFW